jgi:hypothetical protein
VNIPAIVKLIGDGLAAAGLDVVRVVEPGTPVTAIPAVVLAPSDDELGAGNRTMAHGLDVTVIVSRTNQVDQYVRLQELTAVVVRSVIPSSISFAGPIRFAATAAPGEPPAMSRIIPITFPGDVDLC